MALVVIVAVPNAATAATAQINLRIACSIYFKRVLQRQLSPDARVA